ncbi:hypothetical protein Ddye_020025 [Dipteronia dyeriana]|uniref:RNase H type-1 domain-containing protein n=1 Tax=Dipteronia dyeriana TaxID=168575 RepID=A0AAD9U004_9ROSI|nr:hypothetical protein Ddye_020025 [Dipteronia dyeriana]
MEGTGSKNIVHGLPPNPFTSLSNKNRGITPACEVCPATDIERAVAHGGQDPENANDKKLKRALASKKYSHKYKLQQHKYVEQLETKAKALQTEIAIKVPRIKYVECHRSLLRVENDLVLVSRFPDLSVSRWTSEIEGDDMGLDHLVRVWFGVDDYGSICGVLRDSCGKVVCLFSFYVGVEDSITVEVLAIHRACHLISSRSRLAGRSVTIISDSKSTVSWANVKDFGSLKLVNLIYDIISVLQGLVGLSICFRHRGSNSFADSLAKGGLCQSRERLEWCDF